MKKGEMKQIENFQLNNKISNSSLSTLSIKQEQIHDILFNREIGWQEIIYDLINTEQIDPWDINIIILTDKYLEKVSAFEETDFFVSSKVLLAASLLLRIKSEMLLNKYIKSIDEILFGAKDKIERKLERIELDGDIPDLIPRSPMPRFKKVTLKELMEALNKAIVTENRRIKKEIINKNALREFGFSLPKRRLGIKDRIKNIFNRLIIHFKANSNHKKVSYITFTGENKEERLSSFSPLLHLEHKKKIWLEQKEHFGEINIWEKQNYIKHNGDPFADLKKESEEELLKEKSNPTARAKNSCVS